MNAEQLWETTMHPDKRTLLQVAVERRHRRPTTIFYELMGDEVATAQEFIQQHATQVKNLDV